MAGIQVQIADMPDAALGLTSQGLIVLDRDAAGYGWFIDPTPGDSREFDAATLLATSGAAAGRMDLLTVLAHELGHAAGLGHADNGLMVDALAPGQRILPAALPSATVPTRQDPQAWRYGPVGVRVPLPADIAAPPAIDWGFSKSEPRRKQDAAAAPTRWIDDFVNHRGVSAEQRNPNAGMRINLVPPAAVSVSRSLGRL